MAKEIKQIQQGDIGVSKCIHHIPGFPFVKGDANKMKTNLLERLEAAPSPASSPWRRKDFDGPQMREYIKGGRALQSHKTGIDGTMSDPSTWTHLYGNQYDEIPSQIYFLDAIASNVV